MITEGYLARHYQGRRGGRDPALLDVAQDYALKIVSDAGLLEMGLTLKGGTALRKFRAGTLGRFSTDLDFATNERDLADLLFETLNGAELHRVAFAVEVVTPGVRGRLGVETPLGSPQIESRIEVTPRAPWLAPEHLTPVLMPVHRGYEFDPVPVPVMAHAEALAEKLAAFRRRALVRDLYDLAWFSRGVFDEALVRRVTYLKVCGDVVEHGLGERPFEPSGDVLRDRSTSDFLPEDIGLLAARVDVAAWIATIRGRFAFLAAPTEEEGRWGRCDPRDLYDVRRAIALLDR